MDPKRIGLAAAALVGLAGLIIVSTRVLQPDELRITTATPGGTYAVFGDQLAHCGGRQRQGLRSRPEAAFPLNGHKSLKLSRCQAQKSHSATNLHGTAVTPLALDQVAFGLDPSAVTGHTESAR